MFFFDRFLVEVSKKKTLSGVLFYYYLFEHPIFQYHKISFKNFQKKYCIVLIILIDKTEPPILYVFQDNPEWNGLVDTWPEKDYLFNRILSLWGGIGGPKASNRYIKAKFFGLKEKKNFFIFLLEH